MDETPELKESLLHLIGSLSQVHLWPTEQAVEVLTHVSAMALELAEILKRHQRDD